MPLIFTRIWRRYIVKEPTWKAWQHKAVPVLLYIGPDLSSYSQFGEDVFLSEIFRNKTNGTFVDIGANHPTELNNTYKFYLKGWRGVNIEPGLKMFNLLQSIREEDVNVRVGVGKIRGNAVFYERMLMRFQHLIKKRLAIISMIRKLSVKMKYQY